MTSAGRWIGIKALKDNPKNVSTTFYDDTEAALTATGDVAVSVTDYAGTEITTGTAVATDTLYTYTLPAQSELDALTVTFTGVFGGATRTQAVRVDVVGGFYFSLAELRAYDEVLTNITKYPTQRLVAARDSVEAKFEETCHRAFVPRFAAETLNGTGRDTLWLDKPDWSVILSVAVDGSDVTADYDGNRNADRGAKAVTLPFPGYWPLGVSNIAITYTYGFSAVPQGIHDAALRYARYLLISQGNTVLNERATSLRVPSTGDRETAMSLAVPGRSGSYVGIPDVDVELDRWILPGGAW